MKRLFVVTHTIRKSEIPALLECPVTNAPSVKMLCPQKNCLSSYFRKNITCLGGGLLSVGSVFFCLLQHSVSARYDRSLFHERHIETWEYGELVIGNYCARWMPGTIFCCMQHFTTHLRFLCINQLNVQWHWWHYQSVPLAPVKPKWWSTYKQPVTLGPSVYPGLRRASLYIQLSWGPVFSYIRLRRRPLRIRLS